MSGHIGSILLRLKNLTVPALLALALAVPGCADDSGTGPSGATITLTAILPLTGSAANLGLESKAALETAVADLSAAGSNRTYELNILDSATVPTVASAFLNSMQASQRIIMGPMTSDALLACREVVAASEMVVISHSSTIPVLADSADQVVRLVPTDREMAEATVELMWRDGIRYLVTIHRSDAWGDALAGCIADAFQARGGTVLGEAEYVSYRDSEYTNALTNANDLLFINSGLTTGDYDQMACYLASYGEGTRIMELAATTNTLAPSIRWYGSDGFVQDASLLENTDAATYAEAVRYTASIFGFVPQPGYTAVYDQLVSELGSEPSAYAYLAYDMVRVVATVLEHLSDDATAAQIEQSVRQTFSAASPITGPITLDAEGDRIEIRYDFWTITPDGSSLSWEKSATYVNGQIVDPV